MKRLLFSILAVAAIVAMAQSTQAQVPVVTYYQPATVYYPPVVAPTYTVASPVVVEPVAVAPVVAPVPVVTYYRAPIIGYQPTARVITRYRPILGGTVSRVRYGYTPVVY